jgi:poly(hydroxyalkanoate) granule-associated protein
MARKKSTASQKSAASRGAEISNQLENAFLAGLGALSHPQDIRSTSFEALVEKGETFRKKATSKTEELIDDVQEALREMSDDAQSRATGLLDQVRDSSRLDKLNSAFDARVAGAMDRLGVASKRDLDNLNRKLNKILKAVEGEKAPAKKASGKTVAKKKTAKRSGRSVAKKPAKK